ncbi:MAG: uroporphyrinogen-III synthase [Acidobacteriaceae bacterium]
MSHASFQGLRILTLETRRSKEIAKLIRTYSGEPLVVPSMREVPLDSNQQALKFATSLMQGEFDLVIFLTGVGVRALIEIVATKYDREEFLAALRSVKVAARGPKPAGVLREFKIPIAMTAPEPCTWRELMDTLDKELGASMGGLRIAVQEYGASNPELLAALAENSVEVTRVPVYQWALPEDLQPLRETVLAIAQGHIDVVLFMTAVQVMHLFLVAEQMQYVDALRDGLQKTVVLSIGPSTSEELQRHGVTPDFEPSHPKMGFLVNEAAQRAGKLLEIKRSGVILDAKSGQTALSVQTGTTSVMPLERVAEVAVNTAYLQTNPLLHNEMDILHEIGSRMAAADPLHVVLRRIVDFVSSVIPCDSCFVYVLEQDELVLRASKNPHADVVDHLGIRLGQGITGWVAEHREPVAIASQALQDPRFKMFKDLPEDHFEAFLSIPILCRNKVVGVINLQHRQPYKHTRREVRLISMIGFLVGAEIERARLENENVELSDRLETRKAVERAKGILQRELGVDEGEAYRTMQRESRQRRKAMREIAEAIILNDDMRRGRAVS